MGSLNVLTSQEFGEKCNVSSRWVRELASQGRIYPARKTPAGWMFGPSSTVIRPPERWNRKPQKMLLPHPELTTNQRVAHLKHWLKS